MAGSHANMSAAVDTSAEPRPTATPPGPSAASFLYPSPLEVAVDSFSAFDLALASVALGPTTPYTNFLMPSPAAPTNAASLTFDTVDASPFMGTMPDPSFSAVGNLLFDDFDFDTGMGGDFALFDDMSPSTASQATPSVQNHSTPFLPMAGTPLIPLHATPFVPALSFLPDQQKVAISMEDLTTLLQLANSGNGNGTMTGEGSSSSSMSVAVPAESGSPEFSHPAGSGRSTRRRTTRLYTCNVDGCGKQFSRNFNLKTHELTHRSDRARNFVCSEPGCNKAFVRVHDLTRHFATHDQSLWHFCAGCNRGFARIDALRRHERTGSGACKKE
ncbi:hypothetical protein HDU83_005201 [Entophlyctis luteolus]|nr:hypothetical protein HDU83_005201 [Entophlyctis luteolus]